jgi:hypothetical protein
VLSKPLLFAIVVTAPFFLSLQGGNRGSRRVLLVPLSAIAMVNVAVLLITMMLVKTQLTELSFLLTLIYSVGVASLVGTISGQLLRSRASRFVAVGGVAVGILAFALALLPKLRAKEALLSDVHASRLHANKAIRYIAGAVPSEAVIAMTTPELIGLATEDDLTSKDDEYKAYAQHSFQQGFARAYFQVLGRADIRLAYLADSANILRTLDSLRNTGDHYLLLETGLDVDLAHGKRNGLSWFTAHDSLVARFDDGGFASEVWKLKP